MPALFCDTPPRPGQRSPSTCPLAPLALNPLAPLALNPVAPTRLTHHLPVSAVPRPCRATRRATSAAQIRPRRGSRIRRGSRTRRNGAMRHFRLSNPTKMDPVRFRADLTRCTSSCPWPTSPDGEARKTRRQVSGAAHLPVPTCCRQRASCLSPVCGKATLSRTSAQPLREPLNTVTAACQAQAAAEAFYTRKGET